jgi:plastocyanin
MKISRRTQKRFIFFSAPVLFIVAFAIVLAIYLNFSKPPVVNVGTTGFAPGTIEINEGESIHFVNQSSTTTQILCLGFNKQCDTSAQLPRGLASPGVRIAPGQAKDVVFDTFGTFHITSTTVPGLNLTVTVDSAG